MKKGGLGKGLEALLPNLPEESADKLAEIKITEIDPNPNQPRRSFDAAALEQLAASIRTSGVIQPIVVRPAEGRYMIIAGERRWRAARQAGLAVIPAVVRDVTRQKLYEMALIENLQREDLNPVEEAQAIDAYVREYGLTQEEAAEKLGKSRPAVANALRLLQLPEDLLEALAAGQLTAGHARCLLALEDPERQRQLAQRIIAEGLSVRQAEELARAAAPRRAAKRPPAGEPEGFHVLTEALRRTFGTKVRILGTQDRGKIQIDYFSREDVERIYEIIEGMEREG